MPVTYVLENCRASLQVSQDSAVQSQRPYSATQPESISKWDLFHIRLFMGSTSCMNHRNGWFGAWFLAACDTAFAQQAWDPSFQPPPGLRVLLWLVWVLKTKRGHEQKGKSLKELVLLSPEDTLGPLLKLLQDFHLRAHLWEMSLVCSALIITQPFPPAATGLGERWSVIAGTTRYAKSLESHPKRMRRQRMSWMSWLQRRHSLH